MIIARNIKAMRVKRGLPQAVVAQQLGVSYQQIQKYENGKDRITAGRLWHIAKIYDVPVQELFES